MKVKEHVIEKNKILANGNNLVDVFILSVTTNLYATIKIGIHLCLHEINRLYFIFYLELLFVKFDEKHS